MINKEFQVGTNAEVDVHIHSGRVEVKTGSPGSISVEVETSDPGFIVEKRGDLIFVSSDKNTGWLSRGSAHVSIVVPEATDATIGTASGKVECRGNLGRVEVKTASGSIDVENAAVLVAKTASGTMRASDVSGDLRASSASGNIRVEKASGSANLSSASGDVRLAESTGTVNASTASGDIKIYEFTGSSATFKSMSGDVMIGIPAGSKVDLDATLLSGRLKLPKPSGESESTRHMTVRAKLVSGDLTVRKL